MYIYIFFKPSIVSGMQMRKTLKAFLLRFCLPSPCVLRTGPRDSHAVSKLPYSVFCPRLFFFRQSLTKLASQASNMKFFCLCSLSSQDYGPPFMAPLATTFRDYTSLFPVKCILSPRPVSFPAPEGIPPTRNFAQLYT